jgi:hypothetical protein
MDLHEIKIKQTIQTLDASIRQLQLQRSQLLAMIEPEAPPSQRRVKNYDPRRKKK